MFIEYSPEFLADSDGSSKDYISRIKCQDGNPGFHGDFNNMISYMQDKDNKKISVAYNRQLSSGNILKLDKA